MLNCRFLTVLILALFLICGSLSFAAPPDAGQLLNQERQPGKQLPDRLPQDSDKETERAPPDAGTKVLVKGFCFSGSQGLATDAELEALISDSIGKELGFAGIKKLAERVTNYLREQKGYLLARAYLPKQDITAGIIEIAVIAGKVEGKVRVNVKKPRRVSQSLLEGIAGKALKAGSAIRMEEIERAVLLMNDLPGISSNALLERGATPGTTRLGIDVTEGPLISGLISGDNYGDRYTGIWRGSGRIAVNDPFGLGDQLSLSVIGAEHMYQGTTAYFLPLGATGLTWSLSYTGLYYELGDDLASLNANGCADTFATRFGYPILRTRSASVWAGLGFEYILLSDETNGTTTSDRKLSVGNAGFSGSFFDSFGGGGLSSANLALYSGNLDLSDLATAEAADASGPRSAGNFVRVTYSLARLQRLTRQVSLFGSVRGQIADNNLNSSQKLILGGPTGVRAYPVGEASGDEGHIMTFETRFDIPDPPSWAKVQLVGFVDTGYIKLHKDPWAASITNATTSNDYWLSGAGAGIVISKAGLYSVQTSYAHKIGDNPGRSMTGNDADNHDDNGRFWVQAVVWF
ncbi:MAG: ShlB/FhaC/HecB family hemolysin secretion/activation protein [Proteobacteria bacterium]|nr:ShlB/FhaC/HecB family hemolysin secretion/activation protein [Pseudomonadota bacterium]